MAIDGTGIVDAWERYDGRTHDYTFNEQWRASAEKEAATAMHTLLVTRRLWLAHRDLHAENKRGGSSIQEVKQSGSTQRISCMHSAAFVDAMRGVLERDTQVVVQ
jgi:uncharacterized protein YecT (DUF1311 family)